MAQRGWLHVPPVRRDKGCADQRCSDAVKMTLTSLPDPFWQMTPAASRGGARNPEKSCSEVSQPRQTLPPNTSELGAGV